MKRLFYGLVAALALTACSHDNAPVKEIASVIDAGAEKQATYERGLADSTLTDDDFSEYMFVTPDGNIFANPGVASIINQNKGLKLNDEDKAILKGAVDALCPEVKAGYNATKEGALIDAIGAGARSTNLIRVESAETLGDLLK